MEKALGLFGFWCGRLLEGKIIAEWKRIATGKFLKGKACTENFIHSFRKAELKRIWDSESLRTRL
jgi:hypothetical protein